MAEIRCLISITEGYKNPEPDRITKEMDLLRNFGSPRILSKYDPLGVNPGKIYYYLISEKMNQKNYITNYGSMPKKKKVWKAYLSNG